MYAGSSLVLLAALWLASVPAAAQQHSAAQSPPDAPDATEVYVDVYGLRIFEINDRNATFEVEARFSAAWHDPRLAFDPEVADTEARFLQGEAVEDALKSEVWWPAFEIMDAHGSRDTMQRSLVIESDGWVYYDERFVVSIIQDYDLKRFPFDSHEISFAIESFVYDTGTVVFDLVEDPGDLLNWEPDDWYIDDPELYITNGFCDEDADPECLDEVACAPPNVCEGFARVTVSMGIERDPTYYLTNIILPLMLIVLISSAVFSMSFRTTHLGDRLSVTITSVLTVVAFDFVTSEDLPRLWYSTAMDQVLTASYVFMAANVLENVIAARLDTSNPAGAARLDAVFRWLFPLGYVLTVTVILGRAYLA